jgi:hypothetical protein
VAVDELGGTLIARADGGKQAGTAKWTWRKQGDPPRIMMHRAREIAVAVTDGARRPAAGATVAVAWHESMQNMPSNFGPVRLADVQRSDAAGKAILHVPAALSLCCVFAVKEDVGFDYCLYRRPPGRPPGPHFAADGQPVINLGERDERAGDSFKLAADDTRPINFVLNGIHRIRLNDVGRCPASRPGLAASNGQTRAGPRT